MARTPKHWQAAALLVWSIAACHRREEEPQPAPASVASEPAAAASRSSRQDAAALWSGNTDAVPGSPTRPRNAAPGAQRAPVMPVNDYAPPSPSTQSRPGDAVAPRAGDLVSP
jgi:hypothetical protein